MFKESQIFVIKRDGKKVAFNKTRIKNAISLANKSLDETKKRVSVKKINEMVERIVSIIMDDVNHLYDGDDSLSIVKDIVTEKDKVFIEIEDIQDLVQKILMSYNEYDLATAYITYRAERTRIRENKSEFISELISNAQPNSADETDKQNANVDQMSFGGRVGTALSTVMKRLALDTMPKRFRDNHLNNIVYVHDLDNYFVGTPNCCSLPFDHLFKYLIIFRNTDVRPAHSASTGLQMNAVLFQSQSLQQFGGVAATHLDTSIVPLLRFSYNKHYKTVQDILPFMRVNYRLDENKSIQDPQYVGYFWNFIKKYMYGKALKLTKKELSQGVEGLYHNLNTLMSRSGNQLPFTSINYGLDTSFEGKLINEALIEGCIKGVGTLHRTSIFPCGIFQYKKGVNDRPGTPNYYLKKKAIYSTVRRFYPNYANCDWSIQTDGIKADRKLKDKVISDWALNNTEQYNKLLDLIKKDPEIGRLLSIKVVKENKEFKLKVNMDASVQTELEVMSTMGCRTYNGFDINFDEAYFNDLLNETIKQGKLPINYLYSAMQKDGRGNICPNTIIMPTVAMMAKEEYEKSNKKDKDLINIFMEKLSKVIEDSRDQLIERYNHIISQPVESAKFTYDNNIFKGYIPGKGVESALKHGTLAIGQIGLAETLQILIGCDHTTDKGMDLAIKIESLFKEKAAEYKNQYKLNFGVYYSPAENLCFTSYNKFVAKYGLIENVTAYKNEKGELVKRGYFTNSIHVPVWIDIDPFKKIEIESKLVSFSNAGCITYVELTNAKYNEKVVEQIIDFAMDHDIPYLAINISLDNCLDCGYTDEHSVFVANGLKCPNCGSSHIQEPRRITGYLGFDVRYTFNHGKQDEEKDRKDHSKNLVGQFKNIKWKVVN